MKKKYIVNLTDEERANLLKLIKSGSTRPRRISRAHILSVNG